MEVAAGFENVVVRLRCRGCRYTFDKLAVTGQAGVGLPKRGETARLGRIAAGTSKQLGEVHAGHPAPVHFQPADDPGRPGAAGRVIYTCPRRSCRLCGKPSVVKMSTLEAAWLRAAQAGVRDLYLPLSD